jgi:hypothetical protein
VKKRNDSTSKTDCAARARSHVTWLSACLLMMSWTIGCAATRNVCPRIPQPEVGMIEEIQTIRDCCPATYLWMRRVAHAEMAGRES